VIIQSDSVRQIIEILNARLIIEPALVEQAAAKITKKEIDELQKTLEQPSRNDSIDFFVDKDRAFHAKLINLSGNKILCDFVQTLHERSLRYSLLQMWHAAGAPTLADKDHQAILKALRKGDGAGAAKCMRQHLSNLVERLRFLEPTTRN